MTDPHLLFSSFRLDLISNRMQERHENAPKGLSDCVIGDIQSLSTAAGVAGCRTARLL